MGRQQSYVKFEDKETLITELKRYDQRDTKDFQTYVIGMVETIKPMHPFAKGELALILGGERYGQRNPVNLKEETGIENAQQIVFIDCPRFVEMANGNLGDFLDSHFKLLSEDEIANLIN